MTPTAQNILDFCSREYGTEICTTPGAVNIIYLEGCDADTLKANADLPDLWNDTSLIISYDISGVPQITFQAAATSEPGLSATMSKAAKAKGGVFRIALGFHKECWQRGFHKGNYQHPALIQCAPIWGYRDANQDGKRTGDRYCSDVRGLNQHGTRDGLASVRVGNWSLACMVRRLWFDHTKFMRLCEKDPRYLLDASFRFSSTVVDYSKFTQA